MTGSCNWQVAADSYNSPAEFSDMATTFLGEPTVQRILREQARKYAFDWEDQPLLRVQCGESFAIETYDASTGYFKTEADKAIPGRRPGFDRTPPQANPIGGPVWLEGAQRGDSIRM
jgi:amidase